MTMQGSGHGMNVDISNYDKYASFALISDKKSFYTQLLDYNTMHSKEGLVGKDGGAAELP